MMQFHEHFEPVEGSSPQLTMDSPLGTNEKSWLRSFGPSSTAVTETVKAYVRCLTQMQVEDGLSIQTQTSPVEECCLTNGLHLEMIAFDMALSGGIPIEDRPCLAHLLTIINSGNKLMMTELDRLTRDSEVSMIIASQFRRTKPAPIDLYVIGLGHNIIT